MDVQMDKQADSSIPPMTFVLQGYNIDIVQEKFKTRCLVVKQSCPPTATMIQD